MRFPYHEGNVSNRNVRKIRRSSDTEKKDQSWMSLFFGDGAAAPAAQAVPHSSRSTATSNGMSSARSTGSHADADENGLLSSNGCSSGHERPLDFMVENPARTGTASSGKRAPRRVGGTLLGGPPPIKPESPQFQRQEPSHFQRQEMPYNPKEMYYPTKDLAYGLETSHEDGSCNGIAVEKVTCNGYVEHKSVNMNEAGHALQPSHQAHTSVELNGTTNGTVRQGSMCDGETVLERIDEGNDDSDQGSTTRHEGNERPANEVSNGYFHRTNSNSAGYSHQFRDGITSNPAEFESSKSSHAVHMSDPSHEEWPQGTRGTKVIGNGNREHNGQCLSREPLLQMVNGIPAYRDIRRVHEVSAGSAQGLARSSTSLIAIDIDDCLLDFTGGFRCFFQSTFPHLPTPCDLDLYCMSLEEVNPLRKLYLESPVFKNLGVIAGATDALQRLYAAGHRLEAVTSRAASVQQVTQANLDRYFPGMISKIHFTSGKPKGSFCQRLGAWLLVDDSIRHVQDAAGHGLSGILYGKFPWTQGVSVPPKAVHLHHWADIVEWVTRSGQTIGGTGGEFASRGDKYQNVEELQQGVSPSTVYVDVEVLQQDVSLSTVETSPTLTSKETVMLSTPCRQKKETAETDPMPSQHAEEGAVQSGVISHIQVERETQRSKKVAHPVPAEKPPWAYVEQSELQSPRSPLEMTPRSPEELTSAPVEHTTVPVESIRAPQSPELRTWKTGDAREVPMELNRAPLSSEAVKIVTRTRQLVDSQSQPSRPFPQNNISSVQESKATSPRTPHFFTRQDIEPPGSARLVEAPLRSSPAPQLRSEERSSSPSQWTPAFFTRGEPEGVSGTSTIIKEDRPPKAVNGTSKRIIDDENEHPLLRALREDRAEVDVDEISLVSESDALMSPGREMPSESINSEAAVAVQVQVVCLETDSMESGNAELNGAIKRRVSFGEVSRTEILVTPRSEISSPDKNWSPDQSLKYNLQGDCSPLKVEVPVEIAQPEVSLASPRALPSQPRSSHVTWPSLGNGAGSQALAFPLHRPGQDNLSGRQSPFRTNDERQSPTSPFQNPVVPQPAGSKSQRGQQRSPTPQQAMMRPTQTLPSSYKIQELNAQVPRSMSSELGSEVKRLASSDKIQPYRTQTASTGVLPQASPRSAQQAWGSAQLSPGVSPSLPSSSPRAQASLPTNALSPSLPASSPRVRAGFPVGSPRGYAPVHLW